MLRAGDLVVRRDGFNSSVHVISPGTTLKVVIPRAGELGLVVAATVSDPYLPVTVLWCGMLLRSISERWRLVSRFPDSKE